VVAGTHRFELLLPDSLPEALEALARDEARVIGGGTALVVLIRNRLLAPAQLVSLRKLSELATMDGSGEAVYLGAGIRLRQLEESALVAERLPLLATAVRQIGNVRVRAVATVGGTLCEADYQSDFAVALSALGARVHVRRRDGARVVSIEDFYTGPYATALEPGEIVTGVEIHPAPPGAGSAYLKFVTGPVTDRPCVAVAALVALDASGRCTRSRLVVGGVNGVSSLPLQARRAEALATGSRLTAELIEEMSRLARDDADPVSDGRAPDWYKRRMVAVLSRRALLAARGPLP
jgi:aerobic carbon-monoxide dehydrogenase medium subunit